MPELGKTLLVVGLSLAAIGLVISLAGKIPWLGRLPGDIVVEKENFSFYFPLTTSIGLSILLSLLVWLFRR